MPDENTIRYRRAEIGEILDAGPHEDEDWFRLQIGGKLLTKHLNVSPAEVAAILEILAPADNADSVKSTQSGNADFIFVQRQDSTFLTFLCTNADDESCLVRLNGDVWESASASGEPTWSASPVGEAADSREGAAYAYFYYAHTIGGEFHKPTPDPAPARLPGLSDIDWTGPATEIRDELVEIWFARNKWKDRDSEALADAERWADEMFAKHAKPRPEDAD